MITLDQLAAPPHTIRTKNGRMRISSLRPGDWLKGDFFPVLVTINSAKLQRLVLRWDGVGKPGSWTYAQIGGYLVFVGHGHRRAWFKLLPKWIAKHVCEFGRPA